MSVSLEFDVSDLDAAIGLIAPLSDLDTAELMAAIAAMGESQTRRRITDEKTAPDGTPWVANLEGTSTLHRTGRHLLDSAASSSAADTAEWGVSWEHAHVHHFGATIVPKNAEALAFTIRGEGVFAQQVVIPARPIVGLSDQNAREIEDLVTDFIGLGGVQ